MRGSCLRCLVPGLTLLLAAAPLPSAEIDPAAALQELEAMSAKWDAAAYEVGFAPIAIDRITISDRLGVARTYQFLVFRLRNQPPSAEVAGVRAKAYEAVIEEVAKQHDGLAIDHEQGAALAIAGVQGPDAVIVARRQAQVRERTLAIGVTAHDERGTRIHLLGERGADPADGFAFRDLGDPVVGTGATEVRDRVEERLGRRLLTLDEIRAKPLPPYDAAVRGEDGWAAGEVYGVVVFDRLSDLARDFTIEVRGLSNAFRVSWPAGGVERYHEARFLRRAYVLRYRLPGDEYFRDRDRFELAHAGWEWLPSFQRGAQRRTMAQARAFLDAAAAAPGGVDPRAAERFWNWYEEQRGAQVERAGVPSLPDLKANGGR